MRCDYCGTAITEDGQDEATGNTHSASVCREYVFTVKESLRREMTTVRADERAKIVAYLKRAHDGSCLCYDTIADAIRRGEHLK